MVSDIEDYKSGSDAQRLLELLAKYDAPALVFRRIAADLAAEVLPLADDERSCAAVDAARAFAAGQTDAAALGLAKSQANEAFRTSTTGVVAMARIAAVNASGKMATSAGPALAAQSAAVRAAESARFVGGEGSVALNQADVIRAAFSPAHFEALADTGGSNDQ